MLPGRKAAFPAVGPSSDLVSSMAASLAAGLSSSLVGCTAESLKLAHHRVLLIGWLHSLQLAILLRSWLAILVACTACQYGKQGRKADKDYLASVQLARVTGAIPAVTASLAAKAEPLGSCQPVPSLSTRRPCACAHPQCASAPLGNH